jgi:hypothetical protein
MVFYFIFDRGSTGGGKKIVPVPVEAPDFLIGQIGEGLDGGPLYLYNL